MGHIGLKIKERREQLGMSQEELALKIGYKTKSSINKIEMGKADISQSKVPLFANALQTTISYLMDFDIDNKHSNSEISLSRTEHDIIIKYRQSDEITKEMVHRALGIEIKGDVKHLA